ncbi:xyloglucan galactosyltransferase KATAMARI1 homolog [Oryza brachyantha]|uniref:xyloglucan galactosyltransferase KATAMARI1 homolog n=1 Tax=Oryza brachyantha TaxID=4533 RepID=UPI001ADA74D7|nr:xyloglucan galactosyltransferase KATAMARI1 homolog [Oryza brachyantha]
MKRHSAAELPVPMSDGGEREGKAGKVDRMGGAARQGRGGGGGCCSRLWFVLVLSATVTVLVRHCYDSGLGEGAAGVVRIEPVLVHRGSSQAPSYGGRKVNPVDRRGGGGSPSFSGHSPGLPATVEQKPPSDSSTGTEPDGGGTPSSTSSLPAAAHPFTRALAAADDKGDRCGGRYVYVQELPPRFNTDMVKNCATLFPWTDMCTFTANGGFGPQMSGGGDGDGDGGVFQETGWYNSDQYTVDIIFHDRIRRYECLTDDPSLAAAVYVPFFAGLEVARHLWGFNVTTRDAMALEVVDIITSRPEWRAMGGRDHFFTAGRTTWDFRRLNDGDGEWGSKLFRLPAVKNMTALVVEASPWHLNDAAIPFPTAFHPASDEAVFVWQDKIRRLERPWLFSFAGAPRPGSAKSIRNELIAQCMASNVCSLMACSDGPNNKCGSPASYMRLFQRSTFCLQPQGDSYTRKSAFDAMLAGCIPVFFHPGTAYVQYTWHLPKNHADYSVYISEHDVRNNASIEERLRRIPPATVERMRETIISLVPTVVYAQPSSKLDTMKDAFDVTMNAIIDKVTKLRRGIVEGRAEEEKLEMYSWKYPLLRGGQKVEDPHEWDPLFAFA